ncbi:hypothetical protein NXV74_16700 [Bacteroides thetaiotaomicron]|nr:hypothetical protein [Bacteroides thetaiotaomicron]
MNKFDQIQALLGLTEKEKSQILSINMANNPSRLYKEVWIGLGGTQSAVYATEVSAEEYLAYTTEETEKVEVYHPGGEVGRRHRSRHPATCREAEKQGNNQQLKMNLSTKKKNAYEFTDSENAASQQVSDRIGGHDAAILRRGRQPP